MPDAVGEATAEVVVVAAMAVAAMTANETMVVYMVTE